MQAQADKQFPQLAADLARLGAANSVAAGAIKGRTYVNDSATVPTSLTNSSNGIAALAQAVSQVGGPFLAWIDLPWSTATNGNNLAWTVQLLTGTGAFAVTNGTLSAQKGNVQVGNAAAGISISSGAATVVNAALYAATQPALTGVLAGHFTWFSLVTNSALSDAQFPVGNNVVIALRLNAANSSTLTFGNLTMGLLELPFF